MIQEINICNIATYVNQVSMRPRNINFVYGSNGSGKSTLANLLYGSISSAETNIVWENKQLQVLAYNKGFRENNFGISSPISGIFTLGQENKEAQEFIAQRREKVKICDDLINSHTATTVKLKQEQVDLQSKINDDCWVVQQKYGAEFHQALVGCRGSKRLFFERCLQEYQHLDTEIQLSLQEISELYHSAYGDARESYSLYQQLDLEKIRLHEECSLLARRISGSTETPIGKFIEFLNNSDWVKQGIHYAKKADEKCPYCQQSLPLSIQQDIESFFDETYEKEWAAVQMFQKQYATFTDGVLMQLNCILDNPILLLDYDLYKLEVEALTTLINVNKKTIQEKIDKPSSGVSIESIENIALRVNKVIAEFNVVIERNNKIVQNQAAEKERCKRLLWQYFANELHQAILQYKKGYDGKTNGINSLKVKIKEQSDQKGDFEKQIADKEATLTSVMATVNEINNILKRFGFEGFYLAENTETKGTYKIIRPDGTNAQKTLSEGEYNFITFLYFYHLVYGSQDKTNILGDKVVVVDDPISSLDSNVLFIITTLMRVMLKDCRDGKNGIKQMFMLTHNVYFYKEVTFLGNRDQYPTTTTAYWVLKKMNNVTGIVKHDKNPMQTSYELLWSELKDNNGQSRITIFNTLRRILEYYFTVIGGMNYEECIDKFDGADKITCKALISCINDGSHFITDDFVMCYESETMDNYIRVFELIFEKMGHSSHYRMMMSGSDKIIVTENEDAN